MVLDDIINASMRFNPSKNVKLRTWLINNARFSILNYFSRVKKNKTTLVEMAYEESTDGSINMENIYEYMIKTLGEKDASIIYSYYVEGCTLEEIAKDLGVSKQAIHQRVQNKVQYLKSEKFKRMLLSGIY